MENFKIKKKFKDACEILINNYQHRKKYTCKIDSHYIMFMKGIYERFDEIGLLYSDFFDISFNKALKELEIDSHINIVKDVIE